MDKTVFIGSAILQALLAAALLVAVAQAAAEEDPSAFDTATPVAQRDAGASAVGSSKVLKVGMSLEEALQLVGKVPDSEEEVGAACGMLDVFTYDDGTQIISVDGTVTSIVDGKKQ